MDEPLPWRMASTNLAPRKATHSLCVELRTSRTRVLEEDMSLLKSTASARTHRCSSQTSFVYSSSDQAQPLNKNYSSPKRHQRISTRLNALLDQPLALPLEWDHWGRSRVIDDSPFDAFVSSLSHPSIGVDREPSTTRLPTPSLDLSSPTCSPSSSWITKFYASPPLR